MKIGNHYPRLVSTLLLLFVCSILTEGQTQQPVTPYTVLFHSGPELLPENAVNRVLDPAIDPDEVIRGHYYRIIQFYNIPSATTRERLEAAGVGFIKYLTGSAYLVRLPKNLDLQLLANEGLRSVIPLQAKHKISPNLQTGSLEDYARKGDLARVLLHYYDDLSLEEVTTFAKKQGLSILEAFGKRPIMEVLIHPDDLEPVARLPFVKFLERIPPPGQPEDDLGRSLHRSNVMDSEYAGGRKYTGEGVNVLVRDDGIVGPHIDFKGRLENLAAGDGGINHADGVAGVMGGAGNLNPVNRATAPGVHLYVINYVNNFLDTTLGLHIFKDVKITNSSYSDGCNDGYTAATQTVDDQLFNYPTLMHVFSAGNSNGADCGYGAGGQWGNITGGHKQAKNSIATGNLNSDGTLVNSSSRGPAHDGRIKPDICANGQNYVAPSPNNNYEPFGGTSGAAPGIAGTMATLYQAYRTLNSGQDPDAALIKACLLNTANELGNKGPDYKYGWGHVNARRAVELLENENYYTDLIDQGESKIEELIIPENLIELRVMVYWNDPASSVLTTKALINNLDLRLISEGGSIALPLVLDPAPDPATLDAPAVPGTDNLNNVEQVRLENPQAGTYQIEILGTEVPEGPQSFYVVYELVTDEITVTYPIGGEGFKPFTQERIHWDAFGDQGSFDISFTTDDGNTWTSLATLNGDQRMYNWNVPNNVSGQARVRVSRDSVSDESEANFSIMAPPQNVNIVQVCPDYLRMAWTTSPGANKYDIFRLGDRYMDSIATSNLLIYDLPDPFPIKEEMWLAVRARGNNGLRSRRTVAIPYEGGLLNCAQANDLSSAKLSAEGLEGFIFGCDPLSPELSLIIKNEGTTPAAQFPVFYQVNNQAPVSELFPDTLLPGMMKTFKFSNPLIIDTSGAYAIKAWTALPVNDFTYNDTTTTALEFLKFEAGTALTSGYEEGFESGVFPPALWINEDYDQDDFRWQEANVTGINGNETTVAWMNNFSFNGPGTEDALVMPLLDLTQATFPALAFDYAYTYYTGGGTFTDGMRVELSLDCGETFSEVLFDKEGTELATVPPTSSGYVPASGDEWQTVVLNLTPYKGQTAIVRFVNINGWGNNLYLDNINLVEIQEPTAQMTLSASTLCEQESIVFEANNIVPYTEYTWNFGPGSSPANATGAGPHTVQYFLAGQYPVELTAANPADTVDSQEFVFINPLPGAAFSIEELGQGAFNFVNNSTDGSSFIWDFGDNSPQSIVENPSYQYSENGEFTVTLTVTNDCGTDIQTQEVNVILNNLKDLDDKADLQIFPNPGYGNFFVRFSGRMSSQVQFELVNVHGQTVGCTYEIEDDQVDAQTYFFDAGSLSSGIYFLKVMEGNTTVVEKIIIQ